MDHGRTTIRDNRWRWAAGGLLLTLLLSLPGRADMVRLLPCDAEAWAARIDLLACAECRIEAAYFIVRKDRVATAFLEGLRQAACRGVRVRLVVDGMFQKLAEETIAELQAAGVELRQFHEPQISRVTTLTRRMHDKYLAVDGRVMLVGSRNLSDAHFGLGECRRNFRDVDVLVEGCSVAAADRYFDELWCSDHLSPLEVRDGQGKQRLHANTSPGSPCDCPVPPCPAAVSPCDGCYPPTAICPPCIGFAYDPGGSKRRVEGTHVALDALIDSAQHSIDIESPYFLPLGAFAEALRAAVRRGVYVRVLTNSAESTDQPSVHAAFASVIEPFRRSGVEVWEYHGADILHAKTCVIDGQIACVSSYNFDPRSRSLDTQLAVVVHDPVVAAQLSDIMASHRASARPFAWPREQLGSRPGALRDGVELRVRALLTWPVWWQF